MKIALTCSRTRMPARLMRWIRQGGDEIVLIRRMHDLPRADEAEAVVFAGGGDLWHGFAGAVKGEAPDLYRDVLEYRVFRLCQGKPMLGICRGAQILTVFSGGTVRTLASSTLHKGANRVHPLFFGLLFAVRSDHRQAIALPAPGDRVLASFCGVPELLDGPRRLLFQFHPEYGDKGVWHALWKEKRHSAQDAPI